MSNKKEPLPHVVLAKELMEAGLEVMSVKASECYYHDFRSPLPFPEMQLADDLQSAIANGNEAAKEIRKNHLNGKYDATKEESDEWSSEMKKSNPEMAMILEALEREANAKP